MRSDFDMMDYTLGANFFSHSHTKLVVLVSIGIDFRLDQSSILQFFGGGNAAAPSPAPEPSKTGMQLQDNDVRKATSSPPEKRTKEDENLAAVDISGETLISHV